MQDLKRAMMTNKRNQFSQTEGVKVVDAATQTEVVEETLRQVENKKSRQTEEEVVENKSMVNDELSTQQTEAEVMDVKKTLKQVEKKKLNQTEEGVEKILRQKDDRNFTKTAIPRNVEKLDQNGDEEETGSRYALLVKKGTGVKRSGEEKKEQGNEAEDREQGMEEQTRGEKVEQKEEPTTGEEEIGTIYSYAITEGKNMEKGDTTNKHSTLFH